MKRFALALLIVAVPALAQDLEDFHARARLELGGTDTLQRVPLPRELYRDARPDLADVRIFNEKGEPVSIALGAEPERTREAPPAMELPSFPISSLDASPEHAGGVTVRMSDGTLVSVRGRGAPKKVQNVKAYLLDATAVHPPMTALVLDWDAAPGSEVMHVRVEASDDLRYWRPLASTSIVRLEQGGRRLEQPRVPFPAATSPKYLRVTWDGPEPLRLRSARVEFEDRLKPLPREVQLVKGTKGDKPGEIVYDLGARLPVEAVRLIPADKNAVIPATFSIEDADVTPAKAGVRSPGRQSVTTATFYRLQRNGAEIESQPLDIGRRSGRRWIVSVDPQGGAVGGALPDLEVQWRPAQLIFVARGDGPFKLAFGMPQAKSGLSQASTLIPDYKAHAEDALPQAKVRQIEYSKPSAMPEWMAGVSTRKVVLWTILIIAVALLGFMAWRLRAQLRPKQSEE